MPNFEVIHVDGLHAYAKNFEIDTVGFLREYFACNMDASYAQYRLPLTIKLFSFWSYYDPHRLSLFSSLAAMPYIGSMIVILAHHILFACVMSVQALLLF